MSEKFGDGLDRFAFDCALDAAWRTEWWIPADPDFGFVDYFEAAVTRNLTLLQGFGELAEDADRRGILPQTDTPQARLVTDGGVDQSGDVTYRVWCEYQGCEFERDGSARNAQLAQKESTGYIVGHALDTGHHETFRSIEREVE